MRPISSLIAARWQPTSFAAQGFQTAGIAHAFEGRTGVVQMGGALVRTVKQIHSTIVVPDSMAGTEADGIFSAAKGTRVAVKTADCVPVLLHADGGAAAAVHAGWRGLTGGILANGVGVLRPFGRIRAAIGPAISRERFEVGIEVIDALYGSPSGLSSAEASLCTAKGKGDRWHADLAAAAVFALVNAGVHPEDIDVLQACTVTESSAWYSFRREGKGVGSNWSWVSA